MTHHTNPFIRGYQGLKIQRLLAITYEDDCPISYLPLHPSQAHLRDDQVQRHPCTFCDDFVLITEGQEIPDELEDQCQSSGIVRTVIYAVVADDAGTLIHVGDTYSNEAAREVVRRLSFEAGHYSRCWEISSGHITEEAMRYLEDLAVSSTPTGLLFEVIRLSDSYGVGIKLISTPWTDANLDIVDDCNAEQLRQEHLKAGVPESLVTVLHLSAQADVRILVFDPDAPTLDGLPLYED